jgi:hypothetical protein
VEKVDFVYVASIPRCDSTLLGSVTGARICDATVCDVHLCQHGSRAAVVRCASDLSQNECLMWQCPASRVEARAASAFELVQLREGYDGERALSLARYSSFSGRNGDRWKPLLLPADLPVASKMLESVGGRFGY